MSYTVYLFIFKDFIYFLEGGMEGEREGEINVLEKHQIVASCTHTSGDLPASQTGN